MNKGLVLLAAALTAVLFFGCVKTPPPVQESSSAVSPEQQENGEALPTTPDSRSDGDITSMLQDCSLYMPDTYSAPQDIPVYQLTLFLLTRMKRDGVAGDFEKTEDGEYTEVPISEVRRYAAAYFGLSEIKMDFYSQQFFDGQYIRVRESPPENGISYVVEEDTVIHTGGNISATVIARSGDVGYRRLIYTLRTKRDMGTEIVSMRSAPEEFGLYAINKALFTPSSIIGVPVNSLSAGQFDIIPFGNDFVTTIKSGAQMRVGILETSSGKSERYITVGQYGGELPEVATMGGNLLLYYPDRISVLDQSLLVKEIFMLPTGLLEYTDSATEKMALSPAMDTIAFSDNRGIWYYSLGRNSRQLILEHPEPSGGIELHWQPLGEFDSKTGQLLIGTKSRGGIGQFSVCDSRGSYRMVQISGGDNMLMSFLGDTLLVFNPEYVYREPVLPYSFAQYNSYTSSISRVGTAYKPDERGSAILGERGLYYSEYMPVGKDLVDSCSVRLMSGKSGKITVSEFGYVDKNPMLTILGASQNGRIAVRCSGTFINRIAII